MAHKKLLFTLIGLCMIFCAASVMADEIAKVEAKLTADNLAKLEKGETILLDQTYTDKEGKTRGKGLAITLVNKPKDEVWKFLPQFNTYKEFMPRLVESKIYSNSGNKIGADYTLKVLVKKVNYSCMHTLNKEKGVISWTLDKSRKNDIAATDGFWYLKDYNGKTILAYTVAVDTGMAVPKTIQDYLTKKDLPNVVNAVKKRVESGGTYKK